MQDLDFSSGQSGPIDLEHSHGGIQDTPQDFHVPDRISNAQDDDRNFNFTAHRSDSETRRNNVVDPYFHRGGTGGSFRGPGIDFDAADLSWWG